LYKICFGTKENSKTFKNLEKAGVIIEKYDADTFMDDVVNNEIIKEGNLLE